MIKKILISQPEPSSEKSPYYDIAKDFGVELVFRPFIKVEGLSPKEFRQQKIGLLDYTAVVFTSRHAIDNYFKLANEGGLHGHLEVCLKHYYREYTHSFHGKQEEERLEPRLIPPSVEEHPSCH